MASGVVSRARASRRGRAACALLTVLGALAPVARAQAPDPSPGACLACGSQGKLDCPKHGKAALLQERGVHFCSVAAACKFCGGVLATDCKQCRNLPVEKELQDRLELVRKWREERRTKVDAFVGNGEPLEHLVTEHLDLAFSIKNLTVGRDKLDEHQAMHLYGERIEALRKQFVELLGIDDRALPARLEVFMCRDAQAQANLAPHATGIAAGGRSVGSKLMGSPAVYCMWQDRRTLNDDEALHRNIVHNVTHLLLANMTPSKMIGNPGNGWVDEGLAHWFEDKVTGKCTNFCFEEVLMQTGASFKAGRWRVPVRHMCDEGKLESFPTLAPKNTDELTFPEHAQAFAMVDYLLASGGGPKLRDFVRLLKSGKPVRDALQQVYGTSPLTFDNEFQTWIKANYSPQEPPR